MLKGYRHFGDLQSSSTLYMTVDKLSQVLKEKWWFYVDDKDEDWPDLIMFENGYHQWLSCMKGFQRLKKRNAKKNTDPTQIEKNVSRRDRTSVHVQTCKKPSKRKAITVH